MARGVLMAPVMAPSPDPYDKPIKVRKKPMPTPLAILMLFGMILTSQWRRPSRARAKNIHPSMKTAMSATL